MYSKLRLHQGRQFKEEQWKLIFFFKCSNIQALFFSLFYWQVIKIWDFETGTAIFEYGEAHGDSAITCMTFDNTERRYVLLWTLM